MVYNIYWGQAYTHTEIWPNQRKLLKTLPFRTFFFASMLLHHMFSQSHTPLSLSSLVHGIHYIPSLLRWPCLIQWASNTNWCYGHDKTKANNRLERNAHLSIPLSRRVVIPPRHSHHIIGALARITVSPSKLIPFRLLLSRVLFVLFSLLSLCLLEGGSGLRVMKWRRVFHLM